MLIENKNIEGLTSGQAQELLDKDGYNELPSQKNTDF